jgi:hypothetical protein
MKCLPCRLVEAFHQYEQNPVKFRYDVLNRTVGEYLALATRQLPTDVGSKHYEAIRACRFHNNAAGLDSFNNEFLIHMKKIKEVRICAGLVSS